MERDVANKRPGRKRSLKATMFWARSSSLGSDIPRDVEMTLRRIAQRMKIPTYNTMSTSELKLTLQNMGYLL